MATRLYHILLAGSSHTRLFSPYVSRFLKDVAVVSTLPHDAGRTDDILASLPGWSLTDQDIVHVYAGHRDLIHGPDNQPYISPGKFRTNLETIIREIRRRTAAKIIFSNVPPVSEEFLRTDPDRNRRIMQYNTIIAEVMRQEQIPCHDFSAFIASLPRNEEKYSDGLHFSRKVYEQFARVLSDYLLGLLAQESTMKIPSKAWDERFKKEGKVFERPHEDLPGIACLLREKNAKKVLDLGSGSGRHLVFLSRSGFSVFGLDNSPTGIEIAREWLSEEGLSADLQLQEMSEKFPYPDAFFDAVISVQVIHHGTVESIAKTIAEIERVLKKEGFLFITVPKERNQGKEFRQIEPGTFIPLDGPEKGLAHHYFSPDELKKFFHAFGVTDLHVDSGNHYCLSGFKR